MNQRIRELAREAGLLTHNPEGRRTKLDVFAELIIKECIEAFKKDECVLNHFGIEHHQNK